MAAKQVREIRVVVDTKGAQGLKQVADGFKSVNKNIKETTSVLSSFKNAFLAIQGLKFAGIGVSEIIGAADAMQKLGDRLKLSEGSAEGAKKALDGLLIVANNNRTSIEDTAQVYNRLNLSLRETGLNSEALLGLTNALQNSFRLSGSTAAEATAATIQLSQGLASGQLRGQELRSVLEQNALAGDILAKKFKSTRGELLKFAEKNGGLDAVKVLQAFAEEADNLNKKASQLAPTIGDALSGSFNNLKVRLDEFNKSVGGTAKAVALIEFTFNNLGAIALTAAAIGLWIAKAAIAAAIAAKFAAALAIVAKIATGLVIAFSALYIGTTALVTGIAILGAGLVALAVDFDGTIRKGKEFLEFIGLIEKQKSDVDKMKESWYAATSAQNNYVTSAREGGKVFEAGLNPQLGEFAKTLLITSGNLATLPGPMEKFALSLKEQASLLKSVNKDKDKSLQTKIKELNASFADGAIDVYSYNKQLTALSTELYKKKGPIPLQEQLNKIEKESLQRLFEAGKIGAEEFRDAIQKIDVEQLDRKFKQGRITQLEYLKESEKLRNRVYELNQEFRDLALLNYNRQFQEGAITISQYRSSTKELAIAKLNDQFKSGQIDIYNYNKALVEVSEQFLPGAAFSVGLNNYIQSAGTLSQNVANVVTQTFGNLENYMTDFLETGKFKFKDFANDVIKDINRIIVRALIIRPIADGILSGINSGGSAGGSGVSTAGSTDSAGSFSNVAAKGAAFDGMRSNFFADGGVVNGRSNFGYSSGKKGIMGEAGPEAILPLARNKNGDLGVASAGGGDVIVNITNNSDGEVSQTSSTNQNGDRVLDIVINTKVKELFASGQMDRQMERQYNIRRKGI